MMGREAYNIADSNDTGNTGIPHLKRLWCKVMNGAADTGPYQQETELDAALLDVLGLGLLPTYQYLYHQRPGLETFEQWVLEHYPNGVSSEVLQQCYTLLGQAAATFSYNKTDVLSKEDLSFWEEHGYVIVRNAVSKEDCAAARQAIFEHLRIEEHNPDSWYEAGNEHLQGIMVPLYRHPAIDANRSSPRIRRAFEQIWKQQALIVTTDKCGFNPPETATAKYKGIGLHWDVSLAAPVPFGTQGILYLTDTAVNQGALTLVPGFHRKLENWLQTLPADANPREMDFTTFNPESIAANAGDFIIWHHKLPHSSSPNRANLPRLVQYINWYSPLQKKQDVWM